MSTGEKVDCSLNTEQGLLYMGMPPTTNVRGDLFLLGPASCIPPEVYSRTLTLHASCGHPPARILSLYIAIKYLYVYRRRKGERGTWFVKKVRKGERKVELNDVAGIKWN